MAAAAPESVALAGRAMGTTWSVKFLQPAAALDFEVVSHGIAKRLEELEQIFSTYRSQSELSRFNASAGTDWIACSPELAAVAAESRRISELTGGAFDVTVLPLVELWGFGPRGQSGAVPAAEKITRARRLVDWRRLEVRSEPPALRKMEPRVAADFSSMAKGFAVDEVGRLLASLGVSQHLVRVGGDVRAGAAGLDARGWPVAIEQPLEGSTKHAGVMALAGQAVSTSGNYRNFFRAGEKRYGHILDPRTGRPAEESLAAVSVVHESCSTSSALATALFALGAEEGFRLAQREHLACLFQLRNGDKLVQRATPEFVRLRR